MSKEFNKWLNDSVVSDICVSIVVCVITITLGLTISATVYMLKIHKAQINADAYADRAWNEIKIEMIVNRILKEKEQVEK